jgi:hypothetical protein
MARAAAALAAATLVLVGGALAQDGAPDGAQAQPASRPAPRRPDGRISFTGTRDEIGNWDGPPTATLTQRILEGSSRGGFTFNLPENLTADQVPFQPWAREQYQERQASFTKDDPHTRCKPSGAARPFHTPYGFEILDLDDEIIFVIVGAPHSWRVVHMDGREHDPNAKGLWYGDSVGHWEGDTLVIDTVGFNDKFWISRGGFPHTTQLHTIERISRPDFDTLRYEITIDDPGAYTAPWTGGWFIRWVPGNEPFDYLCQENNLDAARMVGPQG